MNIDLVALKESFIPYLDSLKGFHFSFLNPLFWIFLFILLLILRVFWYLEKSFYFCAMLAIILLTASKVENCMTIGIFGEDLTLLLVRIVALFLILMMFLYYAFVRDY
ncbi:MAG: hypothetical protein HQ532_00195 [Candidatus Omnitrophica bacterium]|nr:hypothetical protein [Candidatus Omnitrophota bacterium]